MAPVGTRTVHPGPRCNSGCPCSLSNGAFRQPGDRRWPLVVDEGMPHPETMVASRRRTRMYPRILVTPDPAHRLCFSHSAVECTVFGLQIISPHPLRNRVEKIFLFFVYFRAGEYSTAAGGPRDRRASMSQLLLSVLLRLIIEIKCACLA